MNKWQPRAIIFDMDGLLVDSEVVWEVAESAMLAARGCQYGPNQRDQLVGLGTRVFFEKLCQMFNLTDSPRQLYTEIVTHMLELIPGRVVPKPGAPELLEYTLARGLPCAVASSSPAQVIEAIISNQGWHDLLTVRCSGEEVAHSKPWPDVYLESARRLHVNPADCLALEDSPTGAKAALAAGMICYAVPDGSHTSVTAFTGITEHIFNDLHAVRAHLENLYNHQ